MTVILVVDDDRDFREALARTLERLGHEVLLAGDGRAAMEHLRGDRPDLVLMDVLMPDIDGLATTKQLRQHSPDVPIVGMTGGGAFDPDILLSVMSWLGAGHTLQKPFTTDQLQEVIDTVLPRGDASTS